MKTVAKNISLTVELNHYVDKLVSSGLYDSASEVVRAGLRLLRQQDELHDKRVAKVRAKIEKGWNQSERDQVVDGHKSREALRARSAEYRRQRA
jgi:antitoxin ParD1/3/4